MPRLPVLAFALLAFMATTPAIWGQQTVTVGGAVVTIAPGWQQTKGDGGVVLKPGDGAAGCTFTLAGGAAAAGTLKDKLAAEWKGFEAVGRIVADDGGKIDGAGGAVEIAGRSGSVETAQHVTLQVWLMVARANGRDEIMIFIANTPEGFTTYGPAVTAMINGTKFVALETGRASEGRLFWRRAGEDQHAAGVLDISGGRRGVSGISVWRAGAHGCRFGKEASRCEFWHVSHGGKDVVVTMKNAKDPIRFLDTDGAWAASVTRPFEDRRQMSAGSWTTWTNDVATTLVIARAKDTVGMKLAGAYRLDVSNLKYAPKPIPAIQFAADGTFSEDGAMHEVDAGTPLPDQGWKATTLPAAGGRGKYVIAHNTLDLTYADGTKYSVAFLATEAELAKALPERIYLGDKTLVLVH